MDAILILFVFLTSLAGLGAAAGSFGADTREVPNRETDSVA